MGAVEKPPFKQENGRFLFCGFSLAVSKKTAKRPLSFLRIFFGGFKENRIKLAS